MNPQYFRIKTPQPVALSRLLRWADARETEPPIPTTSMDAIRMACDERGHWRPGASLFVSQVGDWTLFNDLTGHFSSIPATGWLAFADQDQFFLAGYNDACGTSELIAIEEGRIVREFLEDPECPDASVNVGQLSSETDEPITTWVSVASVVDADELSFSDTGLLLRLTFASDGNAA